MKRFSIILVLLCAAPIMFVQWASAQSPSNDWNSSWSFSTVLEKSHLLNQAMAMELIESEGLSSTYNVYSDSTYYDSSSHETYCETTGSCTENNTSTTAIGIMTEVGDNVSAVTIDSSNGGEIDSKTVQDQSGGSN